MEYVLELGREDAPIEAPIERLSLHSIQNSAPRHLAQHLNRLIALHELVTDKYV